MLPARASAEIPWLHNNHAPIVRHITNTIRKIPGMEVLQEFKYYQPQNILQGEASLGGYKAIVKFGGAFQKQEFVEKFHYFLATLILKQHDLSLLTWAADKIKFRQGDIEISINPRSRSLAGRVYDAVGHRFNISIMKRLIKEEIEDKQPGTKNDDDQHALFTMDEDSHRIHTPRASADSQSEEVYVAIPVIEI